MSFTHDVTGLSEGPRISPATAVTSQTTFDVFLSSLLLLIFLSCDLPSATPPRSHSRDAVAVMSPLGAKSGQNTSAFAGGDTFSRPRYFMSTGT